MEEEKTMTDSGVADPLNGRTFRPVYDSNREKLREFWPTIKSAVEQLGHACSLNTVEWTVLVESQCSTDPDTVRKAHYLFQILCNTAVPPPLVPKLKLFDAILFHIVNVNATDSVYVFLFICVLNICFQAIEVALHGRQHDYIKIGTQNGGMCKIYGIDQEKFDKLRIGLRRSLKELEDLTHCSLFLNKNNLTAVGPSPRLCWVRNIWKFSITGNSSPAHVIKVFNGKLKRTTMMIANSDTMMAEKSDFCAHEQPKFNQEVSRPLPVDNSRCFCANTPKIQAKVKEAWPMIESSLEALGYLCTLSMVDSTVLVVSPCSTDQDIMDKAIYLFKILHQTPVPAPLAIDLALHGRQHDLIELGYQKDGMCKRYGIDKKKFHKLRRRLKRSSKELEDLTHCTLFQNNCTLTAVGPSPRLHWIRKVLKYSITVKLSPEYVTKVFSRQMKRKTMKMGSSNTMMMEKSDFCVEQPKFNDEVSRPLQMGSDDTMMMETSDICVLEPPKFDHVVSDPFLMMEQIEQPKSNHQVSDSLPIENSRCFRPISAGNRAKLKEAWPMVKSSLEVLGFLCSMSMVDSSVSLVLPWSTDLHIMHKADCLFKLLFKTSVPAPLAIELALHGRQHDYIKLGIKNGTFKKYGMTKEKFDKLRIGLKCSLKDFEDLTQCTLFLSENNLTAVGPSPRLGWVRRVLKTCVAENSSPFLVISAFIYKYDQRISHIEDLDVPNVEKNGHFMNNEDEVTFSFLKKRVTTMEGAFSMVESSLERYGISCTLNLVNRTLTISTTEAAKQYPDAFDKARHLLQLLTTTNVLPSLAIDLALNGQQHELFKIGFQEGGLCSLYGIKKEQFRKRRKWFFHSRKGIRELTGSNIYCSISGGTITAVCPSCAGSCAGLKAFRTVVLKCIVEDMDPAYIIMKTSKRKLKKKIKRLLS